MTKLYRFCMLKATMCWLKERNTTLKLLHLVMTKGYSWAVYEMRAMLGSQGKRLALSWPTWLLSSAGGNRVSGQASKRRSENKTVNV